MSQKWQFFTKAFLNEKTENIVVFISTGELVKKEPIQIFCKLVLAKVNIVPERFSAIKVSRLGLFERKPI